MGYRRAALVLLTAVTASIGLGSMAASAQTIDNDTPTEQEASDPSETIGQAVFPSAGGFRISPVVTVVFSGAVLAAAITLTRSGERRKPAHTTSISQRIREMTDVREEPPSTIASLPTINPSARSFELPPPIQETVRARIASPADRMRTGVVPPAESAPGFGVLVTNTPGLVGEVPPLTPTRTDFEAEPLVSHRTGGTTIDLRFQQTPLTALDGIGPAMALRLGELGIGSVEQMARADHEAVARVRSGLGTQAWRLDQHDWVAQARHIVDGH